VHPWKLDVAAGLVVRAVDAITVPQRMKEHR
jgi:hypothetical protein